MKNILKDPLLHFLLIGAGLFLVFAVFKSSGDNQENRIVITPGETEALQANFTRTWQRPPTEEELAGLIEEMVREEMAYREAIAMGLDQEDSVIRRRLRMKLELIMEDIAGLAPPTDGDLETYLAEHRDSYRRGPQVSFKQVFLNTDRRGAKVEEDARQILATLSNVGKVADPVSYGDSSMLPAELPLYPLSDIEKLFGVEFSKQLLEVEPGSWTGPVWSGYGLHLIFVRERIKIRDPELEEVRDEVERDWTAMKRREIKDQIYRKLRERYKVIFEEKQAVKDENRTAVKAK